MFLILGWDLETRFLLDQIRQQPDPTFTTKFEKGGGQGGSGYHPILKSLAQWIRAPSKNKPRVLIGVEEITRDEAIIRNLRDTSTIEATTLSMHSTMFALDVVKLKEKEKLVLLQERVELHQSYTNMFI